MSYIIDKDSIVVNTPVVLITFIRLETVKEVFEAIKKVKPSKLYHISDEGRDDAEKDKVKRVRQYVESQIDWCCDVIKIYADQNMGCEGRVISGLDEVFGVEEEAIILEDDVVPSTDFFVFCQDMLQFYRDDERIMLVSGNNLCGDKMNIISNKANTYYFSRYQNCWGWATWKRSWKQFDKNMSKWPYIRDNNVLNNTFGNKVAMTLSRELQDSYEGEKNWDYCFLVTKLYLDGLQIVPGVNLIKNVGFLSEEATHKSDRKYNMKIGRFDYPIRYRQKVDWDKEFDDILGEVIYPISKVEYVIRKIVPRKILRRFRHMISK